MRIIASRGIVALACATAIAACSDHPGAAPDPTSPAAGRSLGEGSQLRIRGSGAITVHTPSGPVIHPIADWTAIATLRGGVARDEVGASPIGVLAVARGRVRAMQPEGTVRVSRFRDRAGNRIEVLWLFDGRSGPPRSTRVLVNGQLRMVSESRWEEANGAWLVRSVRRRVFDGERPTLDVNAGASRPAELAGREATGLWARLARRAGDALAPRKADAAMFDRCYTERVEYTAALAALSAAVFAFEAAPSPVTAAAVIAASAVLAKAEMALWMCEENEWERTHPIGRPGAGAGGVGCITDFYSPGCDDPPEML